MPTQRTPGKKAQPTRRNRLIHDTLSRAIRGGTLPDGLVLTQSNVGRFFGVSRAPAADALMRLEGDGLIARFAGRGYVVGPSDAAPLRIALDQTPLEQLDPGALALGARNWRETLYPAVEAEIAVCTSYGSFALLSTALARHYGFSRTTSHEMLSRLERVGLIEQRANGRWVAPAMTEGDIRDHYQMRRLLEPVALLSAAESAGGAALVDTARGRIAALRARGTPPSRDDITALERDLHVNLVQACANKRMRETLHRSQLPLIATHTAFDRYLDTAEMHRVLDDHDAILTALAEGRERDAKRAMRAHLAQGLASTLAYMARDPVPPPGLVPPYMTRMG